MEKLKILYENMAVAFSTYSRIPVPRVDWNDRNMKVTICFFPLIGLCIGAVSWLFFLLAGALGLGTVFRAAGLTLIPFLVTGGIHLDGLLDTADAVSSCKSREERLQIMKDSRSGAFAVIWCAAYFLAFFGVMSELELSDMPRLMLVYTISRCLSGIALLTFPKAKTSGMLYTFSDKAKSRKSAGILAVMLAAAAAGLVLLGSGPGFAVLAAAGLSFLIYRKKTEKDFGGITGDLAGCFLCLSELFMALMAALFR